MATSLVELFGAEASEQAVVSVCATRDSTQGDWLLAHGSLLIVPAACAQVVWGRWSREQSSDLGPELGPLPADLCASGDDWLLARAVLDLDAAEAWFAQIQRQLSAADGRACAAVTLPSVGPMPVMNATLRAAEALARVFPSTDSPASNLISGMCRPVQALLLPSEPGPRLRVPSWIELHGQTSFLPTRDLTGIHITPEDVEATKQTPRGLLVGRAETRAWLRDSRGNGEWTGFIIDLGWDPGVVDLDDLEVTHEEWLAGDLVSGSRVRLADVDTSAVAELGTCSVEVPSVGRKMLHGVSLHTSEGDLLDRSGPYPLAERVGVTLVANGHELPPIIAGTTSEAPLLAERLDRAKVIAREMQSILQNAAQARVIADRTLALDKLKQTIERARGELLVIDRFFGQDAEEWRLLDNVPVPVRVLTGKLQHGVVPVIASHVQARFRKRGLHERVWVWDGGGLSVGGSPTTFGQGPVRMSRLSATEAELWRTEFNEQWNSGLYREVQRAPSAGL